MQHIRKAVFPVAGLGTRFLPATKATPKELLPIVDRPLIQYATDEATEAGCNDLVFITSTKKHSIADHFDSSFELEFKLEQAGKTALLEAVRETLPASAHPIYVPQPEALGLGHAVLCAQPAIGDEPFACLLADDLIASNGKGCMAQMVEVAKRTGASVIGVQEVPMDQVDRYGVVAVENADENPARITEIVEKPARADAPSNLAVVGRYVLSPTIFALLATTQPGAGGEIQLTDAISALLKHEPVVAYRFAGKRYDCGSKQGFVEATIDYALNHPDLRAATQALLDERRS